MPGDAYEGADRVTTRSNVSLSAIAVRLLLAYRYLTRVIPYVSLVHQPSDSKICAAPHDYHAQRRDELAVDA